jgi:hypothetical protein
VWIRSQDRAKLVDARTLKVVSWPTESGTFWCLLEVGKDDDILLGKFKSKEKALNTLDLIQQHIEDPEEKDWAFNVPED